MRDLFVMGMWPGVERDKLVAQNLEELTMAKAIDLTESVRSAHACSAATGSAATHGSHDEQLFKITKLTSDSVKSCAVSGYKNHTKLQGKSITYKVI